MMTYRQLQADLKRMRDVEGIEVRVKLNGKKAVLWAEWLRIVDEEYDRQHGQMCDDLLTPAPAQVCDDKVTAHFHDEKAFDELCFGVKVEHQHDWAGKRDRKRYTDAPNEPAKRVKTTYGQVHGGKLTVYEYVEVPIVGRYQPRKQRHKHCAA